MKLDFKQGTTSQRIVVKAFDKTKTDDSGLAGLVFNSAGLQAFYSREDDGNQGMIAIALVTATRGTWATGGFVDKDNANGIGLYEIGIPNACLAAGSKWCVIHIFGATNLAPILVEIELTAYDPYDSVRAGLTALPNAAAGATGGLPTVDASNQVKANATQWAGQATALDGNNLPKVDVEDWKGGVVPAVNVTGVPKVDLVDVLGTAPTATTPGILDINVKNINNVAAATDANNFLKVDVEAWKAGLVPATTVTGVPKVDLADILGVPVSTTTAQLGINVVNFGNTAVTGRDIGASVLLSRGVGAGQISLAAGAVTVGTNADKTGYRLDAVGSAAFTESYAAQGATMTLAQLLYELRTLLGGFSVAGTTVTTKKLDNATTAATYTLDSAAAPTTITRTT